MTRSQPLPQRAFLEKAATLSLKLGRSIRFDPQNESIVGDAEAARLAIPEYRAPWKFPKQYLTS